MSTGGRLFGVPIATDPADLLAARIAAAPVPPGNGLRLVVTMNLDHVVNLRRNAAFRAAYAGAWAVTVDGAPVALYARLRGLHVPRVTGADLTRLLGRRLRPDRHRPFFVVSTAATAASLKRLFVERGFPPDAIGTAVPPFGFEHDGARSRELAASIARHRTTHLFMGVGAPKSEIWVDRNRQELGNLFALCVGAAPDFLAGTARRAPVWMQRAGLEWLWRVGGEPRRLARRYLLSSWAFLPAAFDDWRASRRDA